MTKDCLMVVGAIFTPLILFLLITGGVMLYHNIFNHDEYEFSLCTGDGEYGCRSVILCEGDTAIIILHNAKGNREMEGEYFKFHDKNGKTDTRFISCDCGWWVVPCYVAEQKSDSDFMIVDQKPIDSIFCLEEDFYDENGDFFCRVRPSSLRFAVTRESRYLDENDFCFAASLLSRSVRKSLACSNALSVSAFSSSLSNFVLMASFAP